MIRLLLSTLVLVVGLAAPLRADPMGDLRDDFSQTAARNAVVAVVRGYGAVQRLMEPYFARFGLTPPQFQVLTILHRLGSELITQRRLARELYVSFPNVTVMLERLERAGLVQRQVNLADRRQKFVALTDRSRDLLRRIWEEHQQQLDRVMMGLSEEEQRTLAHLLAQMVAAHDRPEESGKT